MLNVISSKVTGTNYFKENIAKIAKKNPEWKKTVTEYGVKVYRYLYKDHPVRIGIEPTSTRPDALIIYVGKYRIGFVSNVYNKEDEIRTLIQKHRVKKIEIDLYGGEYKKADATDGEFYCKEEVTGTITVFYKDSAVDLVKGMIKDKISLK